MLVVERLVQVQVVETSVASVALPASRAIIIVPSLAITASVAFSTPVAMTTFAAVATTVAATIASSEASAITTPRVVTTVASTTHFIRRLETLWQFFEPAAFESDGPSITFFEVLVILNEALSIYCSQVEADAASVSQAAHGPDRVGHVR